MKSLLAAIGRAFGQAFTALLSFILLLVALILFSLGVGIGLGTQMGEGEFSADTDEHTRYHTIGGNAQADARLLVLEVSGIILGSPLPELSSGLFGGLSGVTFGYQLQEQLEKAARDPNIKGVLLHIRTPGGTIFGSRAIYDGVQTFQARGKPVLAYIEGLAASGGVIAMAGADAIYADHGSLIGSIGVIGPELTYFDRPMATDGGLLGGGIVTQGGVEHHVISAGRGKDLGNPFRRPSAEELQTLQTGVEHEYSAFVNLVAEARAIEAQVIREQMGAQIFDNQTAEQYGLIDGTLSRPQALAKLANLAKVKDYRLVRPQDTSSSFLGGLFGRWLGTPPTANTDPQALIQAQLCQHTHTLILAYQGSLAQLCR